VFVAETERLLIRELDSVADAEFIFAILNAPKFIEFIGNCGVRLAEEAGKFIGNRYRRSYRDHGFGLYAVEWKGNWIDESPLLHGRVSHLQVGLCGLVKRDTLIVPRSWFCVFAGV